MHADARSCSDFTHTRTDQRVDAGGVAQGSRRAQLRQELVARAFQRVAGALVLLKGIAPARNGAADPGCHGALAHHSADRYGGLQRAAGRMEIDRKFALAQPVEEAVQAPVRILVDRALGDDPFAAARAAGVPLAFRHIEHDGRPWVCGLRLGGRSMGAGRQCTRDAGGQQDDAQKERTTDDDHAAVQLAVAPTLQGCKFRCHALTTHASGRPQRTRRHAYLHS